MVKITKYDEVVRIDTARTIAGRGRYWTTAYRIGGLLVDSGCAHSANELANLLQNETLACLINTHTHEDHIGANGGLQAHHPGLKILAHPLALPVLKNPLQAQPLQFYRRLFWGWPQPCLGQPVQDGDLIQLDGYTYQVIYTPGHSPDHICLYEPARGWLFTGDLFVGGKDRALRAGCNIWQIIASLKRVAALPLSRLFPGSARMRDNPHLALAEKIIYLEETGEKVLQLSKQGLGIDAIARALFGGPMWIEYVTAGHFTRRELVKSYLTHSDNQNKIEGQNP
jgi:glyoxylase-like metal-dependent hydrolase (beta-lactamase superfamily II)